MNSKNKITLQFILAGILFVSFAVTGCGDSAEKTETKTDSVTTERSMEMTPTVVDTLKKPGADSMKKAKIRPTPTGN